MGWCHGLRLCLVVFSLEACALPGARPVEQARGLAPNCAYQPADARSEQIFALSPSAEPLVEADRSSKIPGATRRDGARLTLAAPPGLTGAFLQRQLECHQTDVVLGLQGSRADDPFVLPEAWVNIRVFERGSSLVVELRAEQPEGARLVERAARFAARSR